MPNEMLKEENQQRVLEKAMELFAQKGVEQMNISQLVKEANVSLRSFYRYYESKEVLVIKIVEIAIQELKEELLQLKKSQEYCQCNGANQVKMLVYTMLNHAKDHCKLHSKLVAAEVYLSEINVPDLFSIADMKGNQVTKLFFEAFDKGIKDGSVSKIYFEDEKYFKALAVTYRGFYNRIAIISADDTMRENYCPELLIEVFTMAIYKIICN